MHHSYCARDPNWSFSGLRPFHHVLRSGFAPSPTYPSDLDGSTSFHPATMLRRGCCPWRAIHPLSHRFTFYVNLPGSSAYRWASQRFLAVSLSLLVTTAVKCTAEKTLFITAPPRLWSEAVCKANRVVGTVWRYRQGFLGEKAEQYLTRSSRFS